MSTIDHSDMVKVLAKSGDVIADEMTGDNAHLLHMVVGVTGEAAELLEAYDNSMTFGTNVDRENVLEELGDAEFYLEGLRQGLGVTRDETLIEIDPADIWGEVVPMSAPIGAIKFSTHAGNLLDLIKKVVVYQKDVPTADIVEALGKIESILAVIREREGFTHQETLDANIAKLGKRYEGFKYSDQAAQTRADKAD